MKRQPKSTQAQITKSSILEAAAHIITREGIEKLNTNLVAEKAGVSVGSLYQYFEDKEQILFELLQNLANQRIARFRKAIELSALFEGPDELVSRVVDGMFEHQSEKDILLEAALVPLAMTRFKKNHIHDHFKQSDLILKPVLKSIMLLKKPELRKRDLDVVIFIMLQSIRGCLLGLYLPAGKTLPRDEVKREIKNLITGFLKT